MREIDNRNLDDWTRTLEAEVKACRERIKELEIERDALRKEVQETFLRLCAFFEGDTNG